MGTLWQDVRYGARMLAKSPGFAGVALLTLALGIGANTAIFSVVDNVLIKPVPFPDSMPLVLIWETDPNRNIVRGTASPAEFLDWKSQMRSFEEICAWGAWFYTITGTGVPEQAFGAHSSADFFNMLRVAPILGRTFMADDEKPGRDQVVILSYALWQQRYGGEEKILGRSIIIDEKPYTVIGILPPGFSLFGYGRELDIWMPFAFDRAQLDRNDHRLRVFGRLKPGVSLLRAQAEMATIQDNLKKAYPGVDMQNGIRVVRFQDDLTRDVRPYVLVLMAAVAVVLLIACVNVADLLLARAAGRQREMAIRSALGAGPWRILRQLMTESALLSLLSGALGLGLAVAAFPLIRALSQGGKVNIPHQESIGLNFNVLLFTLVISLLAALLFGLAPAQHTVRASITESLKEGGRGSSSGRQSQTLRSLLVIAQTGLSLILLAGAGLLIRSFVAMLNQRLGFETQNRLTMQVLLPAQRYADGAPVANFYQQALERLRALPGVRSAAAINFLPLSRWADFCNFDIEGSPAPPPERPNTALYAVVDTNYTSAMGLALKEGRNFKSSDGDRAPQVALINESLARRYWPKEDPVGKRVRVELPSGNAPWRPVVDHAWITIVGVVGDIRDWKISELFSGETGQIYLPFPQHPARLMHVILETGSDSAGFAEGARQAVAAVDPDQPISDLKTMDDYVSEALSERRVSMLVLVVFSSLATLLAAIGIFGVLSYTVTERSHEIGIRMALGAQRRDVLRLIVGQGLRLAGLGTLLGIAGAVASGKLLEGLLYGVNGRDPLTIAGVAILLMVVALAACLLPARRATKVDPIVALHYE